MTGRALTARGAHPCSVASAIRFIAKTVLNGSGSPDFRRSYEVDEIRGNLVSDRGLGWATVTKFLDGIPGINKNTVIQSLANLKASGGYARIIGEVRKDIEAEHAEALKSLARAEVERKKAEGQARKADEELKQKKAAAVCATPQTPLLAQGLAPDRTA